MERNNLFSGGRRIQMNESIELTEQSMLAWGSAHPDWGIAWSGGKDSTATLTLIVWLIESGRIPRPRSLTVFYADTRQELPPLALAAREIMRDLEERGIPVRVVMAPMDKRFLVYILGRGVPPPNNNTLRWCTRQIKIDPMQEELRKHVAEESRQDEPFLMITGVRQGESAIRDRRIEMSCGRDGAECGQGWYQQVLPDARGLKNRIATLAPLLHWRVCHVWAWLRHHAPTAEFGEWSTAAIAAAYGGDEAEEINARTGCIGCPLAQRDLALDKILENPAWGYLGPLKELRPLYRTLRLPQHRIRKTGVERLKDGSIGKNPQRMGPLTFEARLMGLDTVLDVQRRINTAAIEQARPTIDILNKDEEARIRHLIASETWPDGWDGDEPRADAVLPSYFSDGSVQDLLL